MSYIMFEEADRSVSGRTQRWHVRPTDGGRRIGTVSWYGPWRCYGFFPDEFTVFEQKCLRDIAAFCETATNEHRKQRAGARAGDAP